MCFRHNQVTDIYCTNTPTKIILILQEFVNKVLVAYYPEKPDDIIGNQNPKNLKYTDPKDQTFHSPHYTFHPKQQTFHPINFTFTETHYTFHLTLLHVSPKSVTHFTQLYYAFHTKLHYKFHPTLYMFHPTLLHVSLNSLDVSLTTVYV